MVNKLNPQEIAEQYHKLLDFEGQAMDWHSSRKNTRVLTIKRECKVCKVISTVSVSSIRNSLRQNTFTCMCRKCHAKQPKPNVNKGDQCWNWKGGKRISRNGYVFMRDTNHPCAVNGYVQEHRLVMEKQIGRYLLPTETVHHKNGIKTDNNIDNLELWTKNHGDGQRYSDLDDEQIKSLIVFLQDVLDKRSMRATGTPASFAL